MRLQSKLVGVVMVAAGTVGCAEQEVAGSNTVTVYNRYDYVLDATGFRTDGPRYLGETDAEVPAYDSPEVELRHAVTVLLGDGKRRGYVTYWRGACAPGRGVEEVGIRSGVVEVRLRDVVPGHGSCAMDAWERQVQQQQIAWTVRANLDPFWEEEPPLVRVIEADGDTWEAVADESFIQPERRPTD